MKDIQITLKNIQIYINYILIFLKLINYKFNTLSPKLPDVFNRYMIVYRQGYENYLVAMWDYHAVIVD